MLGRIVFLFAHRCQKMGVTTIDCTLLPPALGMRHFLRVLVCKGSVSKEKKNPNRQKTPTPLTENINHTIIKAHCDHNSLKSSWHD